MKLIKQPVAFSVPSPIFSFYRVVQANAKILTKQYCFNILLVCKADTGQPPVNMPADQVGISSVSLAARVAHMTPVLQVMAVPQELPVKQAVTASQAFIHLNCEHQYRCRAQKDEQIRLQPLCCGNVIN